MLQEEIKSKLTSCRLTDRRTTFLEKVSRKDISLHTCVHVIRREAQERVLAYHANQHVPVLLAIQIMT